MIHIIGVAFLVAVQIAFGVAFVAFVLFCTNSFINNRPNRGKTKHIKIKIDAENGWDGFMTNKFICPLCKQQTEANQVWSLYGEKSIECEHCKSAFEKVSGEWYGNNLVVKQVKNKEA